MGRQSDELFISCSCGAKLSMPAEYSAQIDLVQSMTEVFLDAHLTCRTRREMQATALTKIANIAEEFLQLAQQDSEE